MSCIQQTHCRCVEIITQLLCFRSDIFTVIASIITKWYFGIEISSVNVNI